MILSKTKLNLYSRLGSRKQREKLGLFLAEGSKCVSDTLHFFTPEAVLITEENTTLQAQYSSFPMFSLTEAEMKSISQLQTLPDVIAVYKMPQLPDIENVDLSQGLTLMLDAVQDPGNLGTILRIASWFGVKYVILGTGCADPFNPKAVQSSMGAIGMVNIIQTDLLTAMEMYPDIPVCGTLLDGTDIYTTPLSLPAFVVMGNEGNGLSEEIRRKVNLPLLIPSFASGAHAESLNVAAATAVTISEFMRRTI